MGSTATGSAESFWRSHVEAWRASGQSRGDYCAAQGVSRKTFGWWAWRLDRERRPAETGGQAGRFLPVEVAEIAPAVDVPDGGTIAVVHSALETEQDDRRKVNGLYGSMNSGAG